jgi:hypothetical protein
VKKQLIARIASIVMTGAVIIVGLGQGCGKFTAMSSDSSSGSAQNSEATSDDPGIQPNTETVALVYGKQVLDHYSSCLGSGIPSDRTLGVYSSKAGTISETGAVSTLTAPMLMAATSIAGEVCEDLLTHEKTAPRIFIGVNLMSTTLPAQGPLQDAMRRIARSCWSRDEDPAEADIILGAVNSAFQGASGANIAHDAALFMCTSMLGSLDSLVL